VLLVDRFAPLVKFEDVGEDGEAGLHLRRRVSDRPSSRSRPAWDDQRTRGRPTLRTVGSLPDAPWLSCEGIRANLRLGRTHSAPSIRQFRACRPTAVSATVRDGPARMSSRTTCGRSGYLADLPSITAVCMPVADAPTGQGHHVSIPLHWPCAG
jgi:hypothetical protein